MKTFTTFASAAALAMTLAVAAAPAHASVFAQFTPVTGDNDYKWIKDAKGTGGELISINGGGATAAQGVATTFNFFDSTLSALSFLPAVFTLDAKVVGTGADADGATFTQTALNGKFSFIYSGPTTDINGIHLEQGVTNLLSGVFSDAWIQGKGGSGSTNVTGANGGHVDYSSDLLKSLAKATPGSEEFALNLLGVAPHFGAKTGKALNNFQANGGGNFSFESGGVPEPATWGLLIVGFGGIGAMARKRRLAVSAI